MSEDERYRTSTQYRLWSYTPQALLALRSSTNRIAAERVREAVRRVREARNVSSADTSEAENGAATLPDGEVDCLTVEEELKLVAFYCRQTLQLGDHLKVPTDVKATAVQYIKRFYITNSLMTYHPTDILKTALFFATKTENHYFRLTKFADQIGGTKAEDVLASEFLLTQGLRFTFDVRHPFRALEGAVMELQALSKGDIPALPGGGPVSGDRPSNMERRVKDAHGKAREYLKTSALLTDVYFHFTPSQIMMAALMIADSELIQWYMRTKLPPGGEMQRKVLSTLEKCADMLRSVEPNADSPAAERKELRGLAKKLMKCRNPEKIDLVALQRAKREGDEGDDEKIVKKRKLEKEKSSADDLFGPEIKRP
ncbi:cyclin-like protein [Cadophora sp. MPI-SDFR-AT-0126]|nr:cyclin-like protein [Leotiomycetes sp. MPI-SDFR-AT-0126]